MLSHESRMFKPSSTAVLPFLIFLISCCFLSTVFAASNAAGDKVIFALTFDVEGKNNSALAIEPTNATYIAKFPIGSEVFQFTSSTQDDANRMVYMLATQNILAMSADYPFEIKGQLPLDKEPTEIKYDNLRKKLYAITQLDANLIEEIDLGTGQFAPVMKFADEFGVYLGTPTYDDSNQRYFISTDTSTPQGKQYLVLVCNLYKKLVEKQIKTPDLFDHMHYDNVNNRLLGIMYTKAGWFVHQIDIVTEEITPLVKLIGGIPELYASALDVENQKFYVVSTYFGENRFITADLVTKQSSAIVIYDALTMMHLFPKKKKQQAAPVQLQFSARDSSH